MAGGFYLSVLDTLLIVQALEHVSREVLRAPPMRSRQDRETAARMQARRGALLDRLRRSLPEMPSS